MSKFDVNNTEGYTQEQLDKMNEELAERIEAAQLDEFDTFYHDKIQQIKEEICKKWC